MTNERSMWTPEVRHWVTTGPGAGNGLDHVRALFKVVFPHWQRGAAPRLAAQYGVDKETLHRVFRANTWNSIPKSDPVIAELAKVLDLPITVVLFAFIADLHPQAVDEEMYAVLNELGYMSRKQVMQMHQVAIKITSPR